MVIPYEIGMIEHFAHNVPTVITEEDIINGFIGTILDSGSVVPVEDESGDMYAVINTATGNNLDHDIIIHQGERANCYALSAWLGRDLIVTGNNCDSDINSLAVGDVLYADSNGKLSAEGNGKYCFTVVAKMIWCMELAVRVRIEDASSLTPDNALLTADDEIFETSDGEIFTVAEEPSPSEEPSKA